MVRRLLSSVGRVAVLATAVACGGATEGTAPLTGSPEASRASAAAPSEPTAPSASGEFRAGRFHASALGVDKEYLVWLPPGYEASQRRYPVVYMLHGLGGAEDNWRKLGIGAAAEEVELEAIIVMPDGDDGFYVNWATSVDYDACLRGNRPFGQANDMRTYCVREARYEDYVARDLVAEIDRAYRTIPAREARAIGGLSMGGYGALYLSMKHPDTFSAAASHAGVASLLYQGPRPYQRGAVELLEDPKPGLAKGGEFSRLFARIWGEDIATWRAHDPTTLARGLRDGQLALFIDCGSQDEFQLRDPNLYLHEVLEEAGVAHEFAIIEGGRHDAAYWRGRVDDSLRFFQRHFAGSGGAKSARN